MSYPSQPAPDDPYQQNPAGYGYGYGYGYPPPPGPIPPQYPGYPGGYPMAPGYPSPEHPQANTAMILGILGLLCCGVLAPFAVVIGRRSMREIDASGGRYGGRGQAQAGFIMGIIGCALLALAVLYVVFMVLVVGAADMGGGRVG